MNLLEQFVDDFIGAVVTVAAVTASLVLLSLIVMLWVVLFRAVFV